MSVLVHRCRACGHLEDRHAARERGYHSCPCCTAGSPDLDPEPELLDTYAVPGRGREPLWPPGSARNVGTSHLTRTCGCGRCRALAARPTEEAATDSVPGSQAGNMVGTTLQP